MVASAKKRWGKESKRWEKIKTFAMKGWELHAKQLARPKNTIFSPFWVYYGVFKFIWKMEMRGRNAKLQKISFFYFDYFPKEICIIWAHVETLMWRIMITLADLIPLPSGPSETVCSDIGWWRRSTFHLVCPSLVFVSDQIQWSIGKSIRYILFLIKNEIPETKSLFPPN